MADLDDVIFERSPTTINIKKYANFQHLLIFYDFLQPILAILKRDDNALYFSKDVQCWNCSQREIGESVLGIQEWKKWLFFALSQA